MGSQCSLQQGKYLAAAAGYTCPQTVRGLLGGTEGHNVNFEEVAADALLPGQPSRILPWPDVPSPKPLGVQGSPIPCICMQFPSSEVFCV